MNPMDLKRGIDLAVDAVVKELKSNARKISQNSEIAQVGTISANGDTEIGRYLAAAMEKVGNEGVITVEEAKTSDTELEVVEGMASLAGCLLLPLMFGSWLIWPLVLVWGGVSFGIYTMKPLMTR